MQQQENEGVLTPDMVAYLRRNAIEEELGEVESLTELKAIWCHWSAEALDCTNDPATMAMVRENLHRVKALPPVPPENEEEKLKKLLADLERIKMNQRPKTPVRRAGKRYRLLKVEVDWSTKPQVLALMHIISAHAKPGEVMEEDKILSMLEANEAILNTRQGAKRIWDYYKGDHAQGLVAHGNLEVL